MRRKGRRIQLEFDRDLPDLALRYAVETFLQERGSGKS